MSEYVPDEMPASISSLLVEQAARTLSAWSIPTECVAFVRVMEDWSGDFDTADFLEKPWKWAREFAIWADAEERELSDEELYARLEVAS